MKTVRVKFMGEREWTPIQLKDDVAEKFRRNFDSGCTMFVTFSDVSNMAKGDLSINLANVTMVHWG